MVMLFSMDSECYISGNGSVVGQCLPETLRQDMPSEGNLINSLITNDTIWCHICIVSEFMVIKELTGINNYLMVIFINIIVTTRLRPSTTDATKQPPLSGDCFLQFERVEHPSYSSKSC